ncbi:hypothetical protein BGZ61DRAFT_473298 [Ilyonectria robusta]|uniref:uncharacterized protein n=1 Tax=Ilyonectria robusta TaxID=1079257 RepID=UPI001E8CF8A2|nr:uncharacterized protein BGZ61DRAFT_473298 [Ilyonectria robusta]KAH8734574.1 hypothetical protein BGZ61DRAFT_473298 [Ilyonectria robusta]
MTTPTGLFGKETLRYHAFEPAPTTPTTPLRPNLGTTGVPQSLFASRKPNEVTGLEGAGFRGGTSPPLVSSRGSLDNDGLHVAEIEAAEERPKYPKKVDLDYVPYNKAIAKLGGNEKKPERVQLLESIQLNIGLACYSTIFRDTVPTLRPKWYKKYYEYRGFYEAVKNDDLVPDMVAEGSRTNTLGNLQPVEKMMLASLKNELPNKINMALRWKMMAWMWDTIHDHILIEKGRIPTRLLIRNTAEHMLGSLRPFINHKSQEPILQECLRVLTTKAMGLKELLTSEKAVRYSLSLFDNTKSMRDNKAKGMKVLGVLGATHTDDSQDVIRMVLFGPMVRYVKDEYGHWFDQMETTAGVVTYRPEKKKELRWM